MAAVIKASDSSWIAPLTGLSPRQFSKLTTAPRREGADPIRMGRPLSLPLEDRSCLSSRTGAVRLLRTQGTRQAQC